jgi:thiol-disulfide isomerase/thioredoxin
MDDISSIDAHPALRSTRPAHRLAVPTTVLVVVLAVLSLTGCGKDEEASAEPLPEVTLVSLDDESPAELPQQRPTVVNFWASWCAPCRSEMPAFQRVADDLGDQVDIVGITDEDELTAAREAAEATGVTYPLLVDTDQTLLTDLGITGLPATVFLDEDGNVVGRHLGELTSQELTQEIEDRYGITA